MPLIVLPIVLLSLGIGVAVTLSLALAERSVPVHEPELVDPQVAQRKGYDPRWGPDEKGKIKVYPLVDKILSTLTRASDSSQIPLGVLVGWIAKESRGKLDEVTWLDERGIFQIHPDESKKVRDPETKQIGIDHKRLSTDLVYSINCGLSLIAKYMGLVDDLGVAQKGSEYYWRLVKLAHTMGSRATKKIVDQAKAAGEARTWARLREWSLANEKELFKQVKHSPTKWMPFVDKIFAVGKPFGVGASDAIVGAAFPDIVDPLDVLSAA